MKNIENNLDQALFNYFLEANDDEIEEVLKNEVVDVDKFNQKRTSNLKKIKFIASAVSNQQRDNDLLSKVTDKLYSSIQNTDSPLSFLKRMLGGEQLPAYYSKLEKLTKEDLMEIIKDMNLVKLLEDMDNE